MTALQIWLDNHNLKLTKEANEEELMEYIGSLESKLDLAVEMLETVCEPVMHTYAGPSRWREFKVTLDKLKEKV